MSLAAHRFRPMERVLLSAASVAAVIGFIVLVLGRSFTLLDVGNAVLLSVAPLVGFHLLPRGRLPAAVWLLAVSSLGAWWLLVALGGAAPGTDASAAADVATAGIAASGTFTTGLVRAAAEVTAAFWWFVIASWLLAWASVEQFANVRVLSRPLRLALDVLIPVIFGAWLLILWELLTRGLGVPQVLLPAPSLIAERFVTSTDTLWADFRQTFLKAVLIGYAIGCAAGFLVAIAIDRSPFLQRGLLPIGNLVSALPIVGVAPIMVMWFGFDWPSKAAVVIVMTFFPMLVNTVAGLQAASRMQLDLMKTYAASYWQNLWKLRLPEAMPFIFNALKINSTLALIGAIVAEFFGTPIVGMGFRISTEVGRMNVDMVWAEIAVAAVAGSLFYGVLALLERWVTFWHPSIRNRG